MRSFRLFLGLGAASLALLAVPWDARACHRHRYHDAALVAVYDGPTFGPVYNAPPPPSAATTLPMGVYDNYFLPARIEVWPGTTLRWTNHGQHHHTVTAADGSWGSGELGHDESYSYTFTQRGVYYYYCQIHPRQMRGVVIVR